VARIIILTSKDIQTLLTHQQSSGLANAKWIGIRRFALVIDSIHVNVIIIGSIHKDMSSIADIYTIQQEISHLCLLCNRNN
jgi:hypothetical protein